MDAVIDLSRWPEDRKNNLASDTKNSKSGKCYKKDAQHRRHVLPEAVPFGLAESLQSQVVTFDPCARATQRPSACVERWKFELS